MFDYHRVACASGWSEASDAHPDRSLLDLISEQEWPSSAIGLRRGTPAPTFAAGGLAVLLGFATLTGADLTPLTTAFDTCVQHFTQRV